jgi:hypothetical protein
VGHDLSHYGLDLLIVHAGVDSYLKAKGASLTREMVWQQPNFSPGGGGLVLSR